MAFEFNPLSNHFDVLHNQLVSKTSTSGDTFALTSDGTTETLTASRARLAINRSGGTNNLTIGSLGVGVGVAPGSIGASFHVEGTDYFNLTDSHANPFEIDVGGVPYIRFVTSAGVRNLEFRNDVRLKNVNCNWEGHFLPVDLSSAYDIGGTPANYWRDGYFVGTLYATGGINATASATQAASIFLKADAAQNATMTVQDSASNDLFTINAASSNVTFNVTDVIIKDGAATSLVMGSTGTIPGTHLVIYDGTTPGVPIWEMGCDPAGPQIAEYLVGTSGAPPYLFYHTPATSGITQVSSEGGVGDHYKIECIHGNAGTQIKTVHGTDTNSGNIIARTRLAAGFDGGFGPSGPILEVAYGAASAWASPLVPLNAEYVRFGVGLLSGEPTTTLWALGVSGQSYQAQDAHIVSDTYGLMLGAGTGGGGGDCRVFYDGSSTLFDNLIGTGTFRFVDGNVQIQTTATSTARLNVSTSGSSVQGIRFVVGGSTREPLWTTYDGAFGWEMFAENSANGDLFIRTNDSTNRYRFMRDTSRFEVGGTLVAGIKGSESLSINGFGHFAKGAYFNSAGGSSNPDNYFVVWDSTGDGGTPQLYINTNASTGGIGFRTVTVTGGVVNYGADRIANNRSGLNVSCASVADNFLEWSGANNYSSGSYGFGRIQDESSTGDMLLFAKNGSATDSTVLYYKRSNQFVGVGSTFGFSSVPTFQLDVAGTFHTSSTSQFDGDITLTTGTDFVLGTSGAGTKIGTGTTQLLGFWNATPVVRPGVYTQTYSTATRTHANLTSATLTDSTGGAANTTCVAISGTGDDTNINDNLADIIAQINALRVDLENAKQMINSLVDDAQSIGTAG